MNRVKFVPIDVAAREAEPLSVMVIQICKSFRVIAGQKRRPFAPEAVRIASRRGWCALSDLSPRARARWTSRNRDAKRLQADLPA